MGEKEGLFRDDALEKEEDAPAYERERERGSVAAAADGDEVDPLDAFMVGVAEEIRTEEQQQQQQGGKREKPKRDDLEDEDPMESFLRFREAKRAKGELPAAHQEDGDDSNDGDQSEGDEDERKGRGEVPLLPPVDHESMAYDEFEKDLYVECSEVAAMTEAQVAEVRTRHGIRVTGANHVRPVTGFEQLNLCGKAWATVRRALEREGFIEPLPIQMQTIPAVLSGRDVIAIAKTGSGKSVAYLAPMVVHVMDQPELCRGDGPIAVIVVPTRELAAQVHEEAVKFAGGAGLQCACVVGGVGKYEQFKELRSLCEVVVCTPGRLIDLIKMKGTNMRRCTFLVLDEADRMFDLGFEPQMRSIVGQVRPDRQTLLFSATMRAREERLARDVMSDPLRIVVGVAGEANQDVRQVVEVIDNDDAKLPWLLFRIGSLCAHGGVLVFAGKKARVEEIAGKLAQAGISAAALHGDKDQSERQKAMAAFRDGVVKVLVATDVASRGLDIRAVKTVVNVDSARTIDGHVHRIGRTGRAGAQDGVAYSLVTRKEVQFAGELVRCLEQANQSVPEQLVDVAMRNPRFRQQRERVTSRHARRPSSGNGHSGVHQEAAAGGRGRGRGHAGIGFAPQQQQQRATSGSGRGMLAFKRGDDQGSWSSSSSGALQAQRQQELTRDQENAVAKARAWAESFQLQKK